jgi:hypothetical protein
MKVLGVNQYQAKKYNFLGFDGRFLKTFGNVPKSFQCIVYGKSGQGKTEFCVQLAKYLTQFGEVLWLSYEQGHGADLQSAINRNHMEEVSGLFHTADPNDKLEPGVTYLQDLVTYLSRRGSQDFIFVDSVDYTGFKKADYMMLKNKFKNKAFIWIGHGEGKGHRNTIGKDIEFDGHIGIWVDKYIAHVVKNRFSAFEPFVIYPERARLLNPKFFEALKLEKVQIHDVEAEEVTDNAKILPLKAGG